MSIVCSEYKDRIDRCWYDSSNVVYSECIDHEDALKDLKVVFKGGRTYLYKEVDVRDYVAFKTNPSQGKALNTYIIKKYEALRLPETDMEQLDKDKQLLLERQAAERESGSNEEDIIHDLLYTVKLNEETKDAALYVDDMMLLEGKVDSFNLYDVLNALGIKVKTEIISGDKEEEKEKE